MAVDFFTAALPSLYAQNKLRGRGNSITDGLTNPFGIERFKAALNVYKVQPSNLYRVTIAMPRVFSTGQSSAYMDSQFSAQRSILSTQPSTQDMQQLLGFFCTDINLPGISLASTDIRRYGHGPIQRIPYSPIFADTTFTFLGDGTGSIHTFFMEWVRRIVSFSRGASSMWSDSGSGGEPYEVEYKKNYMSPGIQIEIFDKTGARVQVIVMYDAYPLNIGEVAMSYGETDSISRIPVTFTFRDFKIEYATGVEFAASMGNSNLIDQALSGSTAFAKTGTIQQAIQNAAGGTLVVL